MRELPRLEGEPETRSPRNRANADAGGPGAVAAAKARPDPWRGALRVVFALSLAYWLMSLVNPYLDRAPGGSGAGFAWVALAVALAGLAGARR